MARSIEAMPLMIIPRNFIRHQVYPLLKELNPSL